MAKITRQEAMQMIYTAAKLNVFDGVSGNLKTFSDAADVSSWEQVAAQWNVGSGLIQGNNGQINATDNITRSETATIILRLLQKAELVDVRTKA